MALTRDFRETVLRRVQRDPGFGRALLQEAVDAMIAGDLETGKALVRVFSPAGNPQARNLFAVLEALQASTGVRVRVVASGRGRAA